VLGTDDEQFNDEKAYLIKQISELKDTKAWEKLFLFVRHYLLVYVRGVCVNSSYFFLFSVLILLVSNKTKKKKNETKHSRRHVKLFFIQFSSSSSLSFYPLTNKKKQNLWMTVLVNVFLSLSSFKQTNLYECECVHFSSSSSFFFFFFFFFVFHWWFFFEQEKKGEACVWDKMLCCTMLFLFEILFMLY